MVSKSKSSSRKSSSHKSALKISTSYNKYYASDDMNISNIVISLIINCVIIYFTLQLERPECQYDCKLDWRHNFVKYTAMLCVANTLVMIGVNSENMFAKVLFNITSLASLINLFVLYSYMRDITNSNCSCANTDNSNLTTVLLYYSYFKIFLLCLLGFILVLGIISVLFSKL